MDRDVDTTWLRRALELAARGPWPDPNPRVGCVLVAPDGSVVGEGFHRGAGTPHAEVAALTAAGDAARGATAYVSLEPCAHTGHTGPCAEALAKSGVTRVVFAQADPNPAAAGGADLLRAARVEVVGGVRAGEAEALNERWTRTILLGRPLVTWKFAATLDGRSAAADGTSRWITGPAARADVHRLRAECDAVVVGMGTVLADDPALTVRPDPGHQPLRVVVGPEDRIPAGARVLDDAAETLVLTERDTGRHAPEGVLRVLHERGVVSVLLEGGPTLAAAFLSAGLVDRVVAYVAPALLGAGPATVADLGVGTITDALRLRLCEVMQVGDDVRLTLRRS
jgi:diaminohydroxyphosphoribosylaminopyrimidine deaminase/5-amino-6-(5-phosphoribosylamino)uracil reductase